MRRVRVWFISLIKCHQDIKSFGRVVEDSTAAAVARIFKLPHELWEDVGRVRCGEVLVYGIQKVQGFLANDLILQAYDVDTGVDVVTYGRHGLSG